MNRIGVIIPALNEAGNVGPLIRAVHNQPNTRAVIVDNGSEDSTAEEAEHAGAILVSEPRRGYGYACAAGARKASLFEVLVFLDADWSFAPEEMQRLTDPVLEGRADLVLGSRFRGYIEPGSMPFHQRFGNNLIVFLMNRFHGMGITDLGPYRAIRASLLQQLPMREMTFGWPVEMIVLARKSGARIIETPVTYRKRAFGRSKVSGTLKGTLGASLALSRLAIGSVLHQKQVS